MTALATAKKEITRGLSLLSLKDTPSFIEAQFPVGRLSAEAYKERKSGAGQTLTALGSYADDEFRHEPRTHFDN
jgi:putative DNA methylase